MSLVAANCVMSRCSSVTSGVVTAAPLLLLSYQGHVINRLLLTVLLVT